jgi:hypothetical protein
MAERTRPGSIAPALRPRWRIPRRGVLAIVVVLVALCPAAASAAGVNRASDRAALNAYHAYLHDLVSMVPAWRQGDNGYISSISGKCGGVLAALAHAPASSLNRQALLAFGFEAGGDLDAVGVYPSARPALGRLSAGVASLRWSSAGIRRVVSGYLAAERRLLAVAPSNLCADAHVLAASHGTRISRGTAAFVSKFAHRLAAASKAATAFLTVLGRYASPSDRRLITSTDHLLHRFGAKVNALVKPEAKKLVRVLGL